MTGWKGSPLSIAIDGLGGKYPEIVYHYTDTAGLLGIIQSQQLWASASNVLNDRSELGYGIRILRRAIEELEETHQIEVERADRWRSLIESEDFTRCTQDCFILSASTDNDLLSQWRHYAGSDGFSIALRSASLTPITSDNVDRRFSAEALTTPGWLTVTYMPERQVEIAKHVLLRSTRADMESLWSVVTDELPKIPSGPEVVGHLERNLDLMRLQRLLASFKDPAFTDEREVRYVLTRRDSPNVNFRNSGGRLVPYAALRSRLEKESRLPVVSVLCGPTTRPETPDVVTELLHTCGYENVVVTRSEIPFRQ